VFGAGLVALDIVISADPATPIRTWAGGTCGNVLTILSYLGWDAYPIARLNREPVAERLKADLVRWGVHLDHIDCEPVVDAPIIVQEIRKKRDGTPSHRFRWACLHCGHWLPSYRSITLSAVTDGEIVSNGTVFFFDRVSPATLRLAKNAASAGAIVVFEPSARTDERSLEAALAATHILKYADQRMKFESSRRPSPSVLMEVKTMGRRGLMYRSWLAEAKTSGWVHLPAVVAPILADTCGSGDWCTAGIIAKVAADGMDALRATKGSALRAALRYGQALAAWNCGFEGARGGMYVATKSQFECEAQELFAGNAAAYAHNHSLRHVHESVIRCPACSAAS
jgi:fructokinase